MKEFIRIDTDAAKSILNNNSECILVDIRDENSYNEGHADGAICLNQDNVQIFLERTNKSSPILVMCYHGNSSQSVADYLVKEGFEEVYSIDGGYEEWKQSEG